jgi:hypothetical protein
MRRLRDAPTPEEMAEWYAQPHDANLWGHGHRLRVDATISLAKAVCAPVDWVVDLSAGNAEIPDEIAYQFGCHKLLGDFAPGYDLQGDLLDTIPDAAERLGTTERVLFVCSETIEHVEDPGMVLEMIPLVADQLLLSTPINDPGGTPEHIWTWDVADIIDLLNRTDWMAVERVELWLPGTLSYQIHRCVRL